MSPRLLVALAALAAPIVAFGGGWGGDPTWLTQELAWATPLHPSQMTEPQIEAIFEAPPRANWCGPQGLEYTPTTAECLEYDDNLDGWLSNFLDTSDPQALAAAGDPPTYCGGC